MTEEQAHDAMDIISENIMTMVTRAVYLTGGQISTIEYLNFEIEIQTIECFKNLCDILEINVDK